MSLNHCYLCQKEGVETADVASCPVCYQSVCVQHTATVRWRWKESREYDSAKVCRTCVSTYEHRNWDAYRRDWIT